jgi:CheY-like chemotaxis protein
VELAVTDTGTGMSPEVAARATEPFFSTKPTGKGTGLGLAQVYGIVSQSGGAMRIESEPSRGTAVRPVLRQASDAEAVESLHSELAALRSVPAPVTDTRILVVDDDDDVRAFLVGSLEGIGYSVTEADCGEAGLRALGAERPDLMLLDYAMPGMNGAEVARAARAEDATLPIVFVTGYAVSDQLESALGPDTVVLRKPFTVAQLAATVEERLAAARAQSAAL